jgi:starch synthase (maltosyl-transferring)
MALGPRIYNLFPPLIGSIEDWTTQLDRIAEMQFDWLLLNPFHYPGFSGSIYAVKDYFRLNPLFSVSGRSGDRPGDDALLAAFTAAAGQRGLSVMMDLVINHTSKDSILVEQHPEWFAREPDGALRSPRAADPDDPNNPEKVTVWGDLAAIDYDERPARAAITDYWRALARHYIGLGFRGFRADAAYQVPAPVWREIVLAARNERSDVMFAAETLGCRLEQVVALHEAGFDYLFNSAKWWDFKAPWLLEQYETFRHIAPTIAFPESHDTARLAAELIENGVTDAAAIEAVYRQRYLFAATFSGGVMMPVGYEFGFHRKLDVVRTRPSDWERPRFDLSDFIADVNRMKASLPALNVEGPQTWSRPGNGRVVALVRMTQSHEWVLTLINTDRARAHNVTAAGLRGLGVAPPGCEVTPGHNATRLSAHSSIRLAPSEVRVFRSGAVATTVPSIDSSSGEPAGIEPVDLRSRAIIIQNVYPELDCGRFPVKRVVGEALDVWADIFKEGHDRLSAVIRYRAGAGDWHEVPMKLVEPGLDRWHGSVRLEENARYSYTIEAWPDAYESWHAEIDKKRAADQRVALELSEGRAIVAAALAHSEDEDRKRLERTLAEYDRAQSDDERHAVLTAGTTQRLMSRHPDRSRAVRYDCELEVVVDRPAANFAAWYEMFPRSQGTDPTRSATFKECAARLGEIATMGFDVVYLVPIHPIGRTHRKGKNNSVDAEPAEPGSPYAIGAAEGGHHAVHPDLGTLEDFRDFVAAAHARGMEVALDFAVQCAPDHPWIKQHPEWFEFRPDGTIKYAENPPKKYQDIVNVNFHGPHREALWQALRDVVLFWIDQGVKIFRVDNPHTKPVPFWEWLIRTVQARHPDTIFLSEAFTRPPMLKMLAKIGFTQSYTYFTWRNFKRELIDYLTELSQSECREYLRPNFFTNTPDILPPYLQTGGRPAFQVRLVLAATLAGVYGIYNGFELCEASALPGKEEYLDSEKYQYKVWDWDRPGNIKDYIAAVNRIRRDNAALHQLNNLRFYEATDDNILFYGKATHDRSNVILVAVNLDPFDAHSATISVPLGEIGVADDDTYEVEELLSGVKHHWRGVLQSINLDPRQNPAAIFRIVPLERVDFREPCF